MMLILFVGDGERDAATIPHLVMRVLEVELTSKSRNWAHLHDAGKGYQKKVRFAVLQAIDEGAVGLVAVVDRDRAPQRGRLLELREARDRDRLERPSFPTAFGEASPQGEAWLLDDPTSIRDALGLDPKVEIPSVLRTRNPKSVVNEMIKNSKHKDSRTLIVLTEIARLVDPERFLHVSETGFREFVEEVQSEIGPLVNARPAR